MTGNINHPIIPLKNLPAGYMSDSTHLVCVQNNANTVRILWSDATAGFVRMAFSAPTSPTSSTSNGGLFFTNDSGFFSYNASLRQAWGKSPRYTAHWDDLDANVRFLLVNKPMQLHATELANARQTLDLTVAYDNHPGLVIPGTSTSLSVMDPEEFLYYSHWKTGVDVDPNTGAMSVPYASPDTPGVVILGTDSACPEHAAVTKAYLDGVVAGIKPVGIQIPVATTTTIGGIVVNPRQFEVYSTGYLHIYEAQYPTSEWDAEKFLDDAGGTVKLAYSRVQTAEFWQYAYPEWHPETQSYTYQDVYSDIDMMVDPERVPNIARVRDEIITASKKYYNYTARYLYPGLVAPAIDGAIEFTNEAKGRIDVRPATGNQYGAVFVANTLYETSDRDIETYNSNYFVVPTVAAVRDFASNIAQEKVVGAIESGIIYDNTPVGTNMIFGVVRGGSDAVGIRGNDYSNSVTGEIESKGTIYCNPASDVARGVVFVQTDYEAAYSSVGEGQDMTLFVPSVDAMHDYVKDYVSTHGSEIVTPEFQYVVTDTLDVTTEIHVPVKAKYGPTEAVPYATVEKLITGRQEAQAYDHVVEAAEDMTLPYIAFTHDVITVTWKAPSAVYMGEMLRNAQYMTEACNITILIKNDRTLPVRIEGGPALFPDILDPGAIIGVQITTAGLGWPVVMGAVMSPLS